MFVEDLQIAENSIYSRYTAPLGVNKQIGSQNSNKKTLISSQDTGIPRDLLNEAVLTKILFQYFSPSRWKYVWLTNRDSMGLKLSEIPKALFLAAVQHVASNVSIDRKVCNNDSGAYSSPI